MDVFFEKLKLTNDTKLSIDEVKLQIEDDLELVIKKQNLEQLSDEEAEKFFEENLSIALRYEKIKNLLNSM